MGHGLLCQHPIWTPGTSSDFSGCTSNPVSAHVPRPEVEHCPKCLVPGTQVGGPWRSTWALASAWSSPGHCGCLENEAVDGRALFVSPSFSYSLKKKKKRLSHSLSQWQGLASQSQESGARSFLQVSPTDAGATSTFPGTLAGSWIRRGAARLTASSVTSYTQHPHPKPHLTCCTKQSIGRTDGSWT